MSIKQAITKDFHINVPRIVAYNDEAFVDNVKRIVLLSDVQIIVYSGHNYTSLEGKDLVISELREERMHVIGNLEQIKFFETL